MYYTVRGATFKVNSIILTSSSEAEVTSLNIFQMLIRVQLLLKSAFCFPTRIFQIQITYCNDMDRKMHKLKGFHIKTYRIIGVNVENGVHQPSYKGIG